MAVSNAERQARYRAKRKAEIEALRNTRPLHDDDRNVTPQRNDDECKQLRHEVKRLQQENKELRNKKQGNPLCDETRGMKLTINALRYENGQLIEKNEKLVADLDKLKVFKADEVDKWLPDEIKKERTKIKTGRTRLRNDRMAFDVRVSVSKKLDKNEIRRIQRCLHPDRQPEENRTQFDTALASFNRSIEQRATR